MDGEKRIKAFRKSKNLLILFYFELRLKPRQIDILSGPVYGFFPPDFGRVDLMPSARLFHHIVVFDLEAEFMLGFFLGQFQKNLP